MDNETEWLFCSLSALTAVLRLALEQ